jgi:hypothetical protein
MFDYRKQICAVHQHDIRKTNVILYLHIMSSQQTVAYQHGPCDTPILTARRIATIRVAYQGDPCDYQYDPFAIQRTICAAPQYDFCEPSIHFVRPQWVSFSDLRHRVQRSLHDTWYGWECCFYFPPQHFPHHTISSRVHHTNILEALVL